MGNWRFRSLSPKWGWLLVASMALPQPRATFTTTTNVVVVNVTVLDRNNKPVENLTKDDFQT